MDKDEIETLRTVYNKEHSSEPPIPKGSMITVWSEIRRRMHKKCKDGMAACVISDLIKKPRAPESWETNPEEWLSSLDIDAVEKEFMKVFPKYYYVGAIPIDFDKKSQTGSCLVSSLCSMNIKTIYNKGYRQIGIVFNTDVSTGQGEHWVALFVDIDSGYEYPRITYFDSYSKVPEPEIQRLMFRWKEQWDATHVHSKPMELTYNKIRHQYKNSECGMYSLYFHYCCLLDIPMDQKIPDEVMSSFRGLLYSIGKK
jgi:hypothetical protein